MASRNFMRGIGMPGRKNPIESSQKKLYLRLQEELEGLEGNKSRELLAYERSFRRALPRSLKSSTKKELLKAIKKSNIVLVGDFHPFRQSQKGFLRLLEDCHPILAKISIGLECFSGSQQNSIDQYLAGYITAGELREKTNFDEQWPFPWENYHEILAFARLHHLQVLALNLEVGHQRLADRDQKASEHVAMALHSDPKQTVFVLYGELHLASNHLPLYIKRQCNCPMVVVHQNLPSLYWQAPRAATGQKAEILRLKKNEFCIINSVPWVKARSYLDWLEGNPNFEEWEEGLDIPGVVQEYTKLLAETLQVKVEEIPEIEIFGPNHPKSNSRKFSKEERIFAQHSRELQRTNYIPSRGLLLLPSVSTNALSEGAAYLLWRSLRPGSAHTLPAFGAPLIAQYFIGYLGSKILNPKRKCNEVPDLKQLAKKSSTRPKEAKKQKVFRRALHLLRPYLDEGNFKSPKLPLLEEIEAHRIAGYILGERLFLAFLRQPSLLPFVQKTFRASTSLPAWAEHLLKAVAKQIAQKSPVPTSKHDLF